MTKKKVIAEPVYDGSFEDLNDLSNAKRWVRFYGHRFKYAAGKWYVRRDGLWHIDIDGAAQQESVKEMFDKMMEWFNAEVAQWAKEKSANRVAYAKGVAARVRNIRNRLQSHMTYSRIRNVGRLARTDPAIAAGKEFLDGLPGANLKQKARA